MATPKLVYVNARGRAELIRFIFAYKGIEFTDERVEFANLKAAIAGSPLGVLPTLQLEGNTISGTMTISRYLAEKHDLAGANGCENAAISSIVEGVDEVWIRLITHFFEQDEAVKERMFKQITEQFLPMKLAMLEKIAAASTAPEKWIYGGKITYADFSVFTLIDALKTKLPDICKNFPSLETLCTSVSSIPAIQKWLESRPTNPF